MPTVRKMPAASRVELDAINTAINALIVDVAAMKLAIDNGVKAAVPSTAVIADLATVRTALNAVVTKLNLDAGVTDADYAACAALTAVAPSSTNVLAQGGTAGRIKTTQDVEFSVGGTVKVKAPTDDLWNLSALTTLTGAQYQAVALYLDASGTATIGATATAATGPAALALLETIPSNKARVGVFLASPSCNYANALDAQGTYYLGLPQSVTATAEAITLVNP